MNADDLKRDLFDLSDEQRAIHSVRFFKCAPGEYGHGDQFIGVTMPQQRKLVAKYRDLSLVEVRKLLASKVHEHRMCALLIVANRFTKTKDATERQELFAFYMSALEAGQINNWDLVDVTAPAVGAQLLDQPDAQKFLNNLAIHPDLWHRRTAVLFSFAFLKIGQTKPTLELAKILLDDSQDLMHKAVGWGLREVGKRDRGALENFVDTYGAKMPRTMLRYAIEHFPESQRQRILVQTRSK